MNESDIKYDCIYFKGGIPCRPNKEKGSICVGCSDYKKPSKRILIIKLGAMGDVIRTTPLVVRFRKIYPGCHITWLTHTPDILPQNEIDEILQWEFTSVFQVRHQRFDIALNLDKEYEACALLSQVEAPEKYGFTLKDHHIAPATPAAEHKLVTGLFDSVSQKNTKSYLEEIFEICHLKFGHEPYLMDVEKVYHDKWRDKFREIAGGKKVIGLNTGCGKRWLTRLWPRDLWIELIKMLQFNGYFPVVLGGPDEEEANRYYAAQTGCYYPGTFSLKEFIALTNNVDVVVTAVSMMMHIATALQKNMILFVNIFNPYEFELYGRGEIIQPSTGCDCYYGTSCSREKPCMEDIDADRVFEAVVKYC